MMFPLTVLTLMAVTGPATTLDHSAWTHVLTQFENSQARVDYALLKAKGSPELRAYLQGVSAPFPKELTANDRKAALINAYNALTVQWVVENYPLESIWRTNHPFTEVRHMVDGRKLSLDQIESELRNMGDPRIHGALVCASISCPPLRREAYTGANLDQQLDDNVRAWLANPALNSFDAVARKADVSMIFDWYKADFQKNGSSVAQFLSRFAPASQAGFLREPGLKLKYLDYNWGLNDTSNIGDHYSKAKFYKDYLRNKL